MQTRLTLTALGAAALLLTACDRDRIDPPMPYTAPATVESGVALVTGRDASVPAAASVLTPATAAPQPASAGRTNDELTRAQESTAMPMAGQNNDHSAPLAAGRGASAP